MGIGKRLFDIARSNLTALLSADKLDGRGGSVGADGTLDEFSDDELAAELQLRRDRRRRQDQARAARETAERAARERAAKEQARRQAEARSSTGSGSRGAPRDAAGSPGAGSVPAGDHARIQILYARLETPYGADLSTVKRNFRRLMRQHHPDLQGGSPARQRQATELAAQLNAAYAELELLLGPRAR